MKLVVAMARGELAGRLSTGLTDAGFGVTKLASTGGVLRAGNSTFLIGVADEQIDAALALIRSLAPPAPAEGTAPPPGGGKGRGGVTIFVLGVDRMVKV